MLRHVSAHEFTVWLVTSAPLHLDISLYRVNDKDYTPVTFTAKESVKHTQYQVGRHAFIHLYHINQTDLLTLETSYAYDVKMTSDPHTDSSSATSIAEHNEQLRYPGQHIFTFVSQIRYAMCYMGLVANLIILIRMRCRSLIV